MVEKKLPIIWDKKARQSLKDVYDYIKFRSSKSQADKVRDRIMNLAEKIQSSPLKHAREILINDSSVEFRYILAWNYKIILKSLVIR